jgi:hypothetical protein
MKKNLFGELYLEPIDIANQVTVELERQDGIRFQPDDTKITGFHYWNNGKFPSNLGSIIYCIYKDYEPIYVGISVNKTGLRARVGRFCCQLMGKTEKTGEHPGAKKYKKLYKDDYSNLTVKYVPVRQDIKYITLEEIEIEVIRILKPICNNEIYKTNWLHEARLELGNI